MSKGYRTIEGKAFLLNGTLSAWTVEGLKEAQKKEREYRKSKGEIVRFIKDTETTCKVYTF